MKDFSIVIPAKNEHVHLGTCLNHLAAQNASFEVIVVDNGSTDDTVAIIESFQGKLDIKVIVLEQVSISALRNAGAQIADGKIIAFIDADCVAPANWLETAKELAQPHSLWGAHYKDPEDATWVTRVWTRHQAKETEGAVEFIPAGCMFIHREDFLGLRFDETVTTSEDVDICRRARLGRMQVISDKRLAVVHNGSPRDLSAFYRKNRWHGEAVVRNFIHALPSTRYAGIVGLSAYTLLLTWLLIVSVPVSVYLKSPWLSIAIALALVGPSALIALCKTINRPTDFVLLTTLYLTYFGARAASITRSYRSW